MVLKPFQIQKKEKVKGILKGLLKAAHLSSVKVDTIEPINKTESKKSSKYAFIALKKCTNRQGWGGSNSLIRYTNAMDRKQHWLKLFR